jgi:hypothetical protein
MNYIEEKLKEIFESTIESGIKYEGSLESLDYYELFCKAAAKDQLFKLMGNNVCMFNHKKDNQDAVMMIFSIPINSPEESGSKNVADRVMEVVRETEKCFITLDDIQSKEVKEDKFVYITAIKKLNGGI